MAEPNPAGVAYASTTVELGLTQEFPGEAALGLRASLFWPTQTPPVGLFFCVPGGAMNRHYFDLRAGADDSFSFAAQMAVRGHLCVLLDSLGIGDSSRPQDSYAITTARLAQAQTEALKEILERLRTGRVTGCPVADASLPLVGLGHSMGGMLIVAQQAATRPFDGLALLGFCTRGLTDFLPPQARGLLHDREALLARLPELALEYFGSHYPPMPRGGSSPGLFGGRHAQAAGIQALARAEDCLLPVPAFQSMLPGNVAPQAESIKAPMFLAAGDRDMVGKPDEIPGNFPNCKDIVLHVLPRTGHAHFLFPSRLGLFDRLDRWARALPGP